MQEPELIKSHFPDKEVDQLSRVIRTGYRDGAKGSLNTVKVHEV